MSSNTTTKYDDKELKRLISEASNKYKLPVAYIKILLKRSIIHLPLTPNDEIVLNAFSKTYADTKLLRISLKKFNKKTRQSLIENPDLNTIEQYIYTRLYNAKKQGLIITVYQILNELNKYYGVNINNKRTVYYFIKRTRLIKERIRKKLKKQISSR